MRRFVAFGPAFVVLLTAATVLVAAPEAIRRILSEQTRARVLLAQREIDGDEILDRLNRATRNVAQAVEPSVVHIEILTSTRPSSGAGWVYDDLGHVVTNAHVVAGASIIQVQFLDGRVARAEIVGADPVADVAVIKVPSGSHLIPARRASGERLLRGDRVFAFGSPFGYKFSMSEGIVSGLGRSARAAEGFASLTNFIQTDAAVNPGNSGGPLTDIRGRVVGMNVAIATASQANGTTEGQSSGISFAIPLDTVERRVNQLLTVGQAQGGWLGIEYRPEQAYGKDDYEGQGLLVLNPVPGGGAEAAGIKRGDFIIAIDGQSVANDDVLRAVVGVHSPGESVVLTIWRDGETLQIPVVLGEVPRQQKVAQAQSRLGQQFGMFLQSSGRGAGQSRFVRIVIPDDDCPAARSGLRNGDVLVAVEAETVSTIAEATQALLDSGVFSGDPVVLRVTRNGGEGESEIITLRLR